MIALEKHHTYRPTLTRCPRCEAQPGSHAWGPTWLQELTLSDGPQSVYAVVCRRPSCGFVEIRGMCTAPSATARPASPSWLRNAIARHPATFAAAAVVNGIALGFVLALL
jgi:hypothetical protein